MAERELAAIFTAMPRATIRDADPQQKEQLFETLLHELTQAERILQKKADQAKKHVNKIVANSATPYDATRLAHICDSIMEITDEYQRQMELCILAKPTHRQNGLQSAEAITETYSAMVDSGQVAIAEFKRRKREEEAAQAMAALQNQQQPMQVVQNAPAQPERPRKPDDGLKPSILTGEFAVFEFEQWLAKFHAYYNSGKLSLADYIREVAYFGSQHYFW